MTDSTHRGGHQPDPFDARLDEALKSLPRETAGVGFTTRVVAHLDDRPRTSHRARVWPALIAVSAALLVALVVGREWWHQRQLQESLDRIATLRQEQQALEQELLHLRRLAADSRPMLHLGGDREVDWVLDLQRLQQGESEASANTFRRRLSQGGSLVPARTTSSGEVQPAVFRARPAY